MFYLIFRRLVNTDFGLEQQSIHEAYCSLFDQSQSGRLALMQPLLLTEFGVHASSASYTLMVVLRNDFSRFFRGMFIWSLAIRFDSDGVLSLNDHP